MDYGHESMPHEDEILVALGSILASARFKTSATQSRLLRFVVEKMLASEEIQAMHIALELYGPGSTDIHRVKSTANIVRSKLSAYYKSAGSDDLIRISLPPGPGYKPRFRYNFDARALQALKRGIVAQTDLDIDSLWRARLLLGEARYIEPRYAPIHEEISENGILSFVLDHLFNDSVSELASIEISGDESPASNRWAWRQALKLNPRSWRAALVRAWTLFFSHEWSLAAKAFIDAFELNPRDAGQSLSYATYQVLTGKEEQALNIVSERLRTSPQSVGTILLSGFLLYLTRRFEGAAQVLAQVDLLVGTSKLKTVLFVLCRIETGHADYASELLSEITSTWTHEFMGNPAFPGLAIYCHVRAGQIEAAKIQWESMRLQSSRKPMQFAIAYMAFGRHGRALACLDRAYRQGDIFVSLIHIMPLFDPLREHPRFAEMVKILKAKLDI